MAKLIDRLLGRGIDFGLVTSQVSMLGTGEAEKILVDYKSFVEHGYMGNGPIWSLIQVRAQALSEVEFAYQDLETRELLPGGVDLLRTPWPGGSTGDLETKIEVSVSLSGDAFVHRQPMTDYVELLRPDLVDIVAGRRDGVKQILGYTYYPEGRFKDFVFIPTEEVAHIAPMPDPMAAFRGMSWIRPIALEGDADTLMTKHKGKFFYNGTTPTLAIIAKSGMHEDTKKALKAQFRDRYESWENAYKTIFIEGDASIKTVGVGLEQISFSQVQGKGETRLANAANVPPIVVGFSEGMQAGTFSNYGQAIRKFNDFFCRPRWRQDAEALRTLVDVPDGHRLWYDDRHISFLQQDASDAAEIRSRDALTLEALIRGGFTPESATKAVTNDNFTDLQHTGLVSVQLQPPGTINTGAADALEAASRAHAQLETATADTDDGDTDE